MLTMCLCAVLLALVPGGPMRHGSRGENLVMKIMIGGALGVAVAFWLGLAGATRPVTVATEELVSLRNGEVASGHFFLGVGTLEGRQYYFYFKKQDSGFVLEKLATDDVTIYEEDRADGRLVVLRKKFVSSRTYLWALPPLERIHRIHVPKGSIKRDFTLG